MACCRQIKLFDIMAGFLKLFQIFLFFCKPIVKISIWSLQKILLTRKNVLDQHYGYGSIEFCIPPTDSALFDTQTNSHVHNE